MVALLVVLSVVDISGLTGPVRGAVGGCCIVVGTCEDTVTSVLVEHVGDKGVADIRVCGGWEALLDIECTLGITSLGANAWVVWLSLWKGLDTHVAWSIWCKGSSGHQSKVGWVSWCSLSVEVGSGNDNVKVGLVTTVVVHGAFHECSAEEGTLDVGQGSRVWARCSWLLARVTFKVCKV